VPPSPSAPEYVDELLQPSRTTADGVFKPEAVAWLLNRARTHARLSETENMALVGIISFALFKRAFFDEFATRVQSADHNVTSVADYRADHTGSVLASV
jgi:hypothetical protein